MIDTLELLAKEKIFSPDEIALKSALWKSEGQKIVFTNGVFDLLHIGHLSYLMKAASLGTKLIIGVNSDISVKRLKGENRPINAEYSRLLMLASLFYVSGVIVFNEDTPLALIMQVKPDVLVKGADYSIDTIVGAKEVLADGGEVQTIEFIDGYSSTKLIAKINTKNE
ncbi:D-glycero-beta-D-manno-heptose 1-phosphate adenylyltransferase [Pedobacter sp. N23S346]|uniref:D-glycero-beta-D-manno-heptose 1-phosphate adenylyltransferase n=1 Tax=Pedobacter sp. N23S346 TaxID=3402750 RepID=UPI003AD64B50